MLSCVNLIFMLPNIILFKFYYRPTLRLSIPEIIAVYVGKF